MNLLGRRAPFQSIIAKEPWAGAHHRVECASYGAAHSLCLLPEAKALMSPGTSSPQHHMGGFHKQLGRNYAPKFFYF